MRFGGCVGQRHPDAAYGGRIPEIICNGRGTRPPGQNAARPPSLVKVLQNVSSLVVQVPWVSDLNVVQRLPSALWHAVARRTPRCTAAVVDMIAHGFCLQIDSSGIRRSNLLCAAGRGIYGGNANGIVQSATCICRWAQINPWTLAGPWENYVEKSNLAFRPCTTTMSACSAA